MLHRTLIRKYGVVATTCNKVGHLVWFLLDEEDETG